MARGMGPTCQTCGKITWRSRKIARQMARKLHPGETLNEYRCGDGWHIGHTPPYVKAGIYARQPYGRFS